MQAQRYLKELAQAHYLYRRAVVGSATQDAQRTRIAIYQRMYHAETGDWPPMGLINATILKYEPEFSQNLFRQSMVANACNQFKHDANCKGPTREFKTPPSKKNYCAVDRTASPYKQTAQLTNALVKAANDGARLEAVLYRPEFGELILDCGNSSPTHPSRMDAKGHHGHGVQHALETRHNITPYEIAKTLIFGEVTQDSEDKSRLLVRLDTSHVILEKEIRQGSGRVSSTRAKLHTAIRKSRQ